MMKSWKKMAAFLAVGAVGCSGGGENVAGIDGGDVLPPVATSIASQGRITGFGSIIVNGVRYDTSSATFSIDGAPGSQSDLSVGQVVTVLGTIGSAGTTGTADTVIFDDVVEGPVEAIDVAGATLVVLGQTVIINADTTFEVGISPASVLGIALGDVLEVSGYRDADGNVVATFVDREDSPGEFEVTGFAGNVDTTAMTFTIQGLTVDYGAAMVNDFPGGQPENGQLVEAKGSAFGGGGELLATEIEFKGNDFGFDDVDDVEIEGLVTRFVSATDFDVAGIPVITTGATIYEGGTSADIVLNRKIEVEGDFNSSGVLVADKVELKQAGDVRVGGPVETVQSNNVTVLGLQIFTNVGTEFDDQSDQDLESFGIGDISAGDYVEIRMFDDGGQLVATRLERDDDPGEAFLRGFVESVNDPEFSILGVTIQTNGGTEFRDATDAPIAAATFFGQANGRLVEADGAYSGGVIVADEVEFEN